MASQTTYNKLYQLAGAKYDPVFLDEIQSTADQIANYGNYQGKYGGQIDQVTGLLANAKPYKSKYSGYINGLAGQIGNYGDYKSRYQGQIDDTTKKIMGYGEYDSEYQPKMKEAAGRIENYGDYASRYQDQIDGYMDQLANWDYDPEQDASYKAYEQIYTDKGNRAMQDTLGQVAARTGGMASSYAGTAAQQSYNNYMQQLAAMVPELEQLAYNRANNALNMYNAADDREYGRWQDARNDLYNQVGMYSDLDSAAYSQWLNNLNALYSRQNMLQGLDATEYGRWGDKYNQLLSTQSMLQGLDETDYGRYQDLLGNLYQYGTYLQGLDNTEYGRWQDALNNLYNQQAMYQNLESGNLGLWEALNSQDWKQLEAMGYIDQLDEAAAAAAAGYYGGYGGGTGGGTGGGAEGQYATGSVYQDVVNSLAQDNSDANRKLLSNYVEANSNANKAAGNAGDNYETADIAAARKVLQEPYKEAAQSLQESQKKSKRGQQQ